VEEWDKYNLYVVASGVMIITPPATTYSFHPGLVSTTLGTYRSRIMIQSLMMAF
jgi:hypothetical protein